MEKKLITLSRDDLHRIIEESINNYLKTEGIDINTTNGNRVISVNNDHQNYVDTNDAHNPYVFSNTHRGFRVLSIFKRSETSDYLDANPLLNALKQRKGWEFANAKSDLFKLLRNFVAASKLLPKYDTIIMTPSNNDLNHIAFNYLKRIVKHDAEYDKFFEKLTAEDVYERMIDDNYIKDNFQDYKRVWNDIDAAFAKMMKENNGIFSYKYLQRSAYREAIVQSMKINATVDCELNYDDTINGKDVLVFDDTVTTGKTISDSGSAILSMFTPKSITYVTLFSALSKEGDGLTKTNEI